MKEGWGRVEVGEGMGEKRRYGEREKEHSLADYQRFHLKGHQEG